MLKICWQDWTKWNLLRGHLIMSSIGPLTSMSCWRTDNVEDEDSDNEGQKQTPQTNPCSSKRTTPTSRMQTRNPNRQRDQSERNTKVFINRNKIVIFILWNLTIIVTVLLNEKINIRINVLEHLTLILFISLLDSINYLKIIDKRY